MDTLRIWRRRSVEVVIRLASQRLQEGWSTRDM